LRSFMQSFFDNGPDKAAFVGREATVRARCNFAARGYRANFRFAAPADYHLLPMALPNLLSSDTRAASLLALSAREPHRDHQHRLHTDDLTKRRGLEMVTNVLLLAANAAASLRGSVPSPHGRVHVNTVA
jgi:hypothetical protein